MKNMNQYQIQFEPDGKKITVHRGETILEAAARAGIIINTPCGGKGVCKKCIVELQPSRKRVCACQYGIEEDLFVKIPARSRFFEHKILTKGLETELICEPDVYKKYLTSSSEKKNLGLAVDIGTTTVVVKLVDMISGSTLSTNAALNPQVKYGDNVVSRISYADTQEKLTELHKQIIGCINDLTTAICKKYDCRQQDIFEACAVGNTAMNHIFLKLPVQQLGIAPYKPAQYQACTKKPREIPVAMNSAGSIYTPPNIAGFVGSDIIAVALAADIDGFSENSLIIDIGTNGELLLAKDDKIYAASCAAGPALEGAGISCGSRAAEGAIEAVYVNQNDIDFDVIGSVEPTSICGSGLLDAAAILADLGIIDSTGRFVEREKLAHLDDAITSRISKMDNQTVFLLAENNGEKIYVSQADIRQIQLAKAAVRAGIHFLQQKLEIKQSEIKHVYVAGAFGNYINLESAQKIGLLPNVPEQVFHFIGNAAATGAQMMLLCSEYRKKAENLANKIEYVEIAYEKSFEIVFAQSMAF